MEGQPIAFSKHTNGFTSPSARGTVSFLDRRNPPRKCRLKECSPGETWYTSICLGEMAPTFAPSRKTLTTPPSPIAGLGCWARPRPSRDAARITTSIGNAGQIRFGARHSWMVAPTSLSMPSEVSLPLVAATLTIVVHRPCLTPITRDDQQKITIPYSWPLWDHGTIHLGEARRRPCRRLCGHVWPTQMSVLTVTSAGRDDFRDAGFSCAPSCLPNRLAHGVPPGLEALGGGPLALLRS